MLQRLAQTRKNSKKTDFCSQCYQTAHQPTYRAVGIPLHVLTLLQVQQAAGPRCSPLRGARREGAPQVQDQEAGGENGCQEGRNQCQKSNQMNNPMDKYVVLTSKTVIKISQSWLALPCLMCLRIDRIYFV